MKGLIWLIAMNTAVFGVIGDNLQSAPVELTNEEMEVLLKYHNKYRRKVVPYGANIRFVVWDEDLAGHAQAYANKCIFAHSAMYIYEPYGVIGENIYITNEPMEEPGDINLSVTSWYNEYKFYNYTSNVCASSKMCGHYTQVVWDSTYAIGCGKAKCKNNLQIERKTYVKPTIVICKYGPSGNVRPLFSEKPRRPYKKGDRCSECPEDAPYCDDYLCHTESQTNETNAGHPNFYPLAPSTATAHWTTYAQESTLNTTPMLKLQCFVCDGQSSIDACVKLNQSAACDSSLLDNANTSWSCARYKDHDLVKMSCMVVEECSRRLQQQQQTLAECCNEDLCNKARNVQTPLVLLMLVVTAHLLFC